MLVIPAMHIRGGCCTRTAVGEPGTEGLYPLAPVDVARLWRGENAKALHVVCLDFADAVNNGLVPQLRELVQAVDIAVQLGGVFGSEEDVRVAMEDIGVYRAVLDPAGFPLGGSLDGLLRHYGPRRIVVGVRVLDGMIIPGARGGDPEEATAFVSRLAAAGVQRILLTDAASEENPSGPPFDILRSLAESTNLSITLNGSVRHYRDLKLLQQLHPRKVDSVVLDDVLYANVFPCQRIWRLAERQLLAQQRLW